MLLPYFLIRTMPGLADADRMKTGTVEEGFSDACVPGRPT